VEWGGVRFFPKKQTPPFYLAFRSNKNETNLEKRAIVRLVIRI